MDSTFIYVLNLLLIKAVLPLGSRIDTIKASGAEILFVVV